MKAKTTPQFSVHLDAIRGLAALAVFLGHARDMFLRSSLHGGAVALQHASGPVIHGLRAAGRSTIGHEAVMVFFVLSGFLVGGSAIQNIQLGRWSWGKYLFQRFTRLWVVLLPALLLGVALDTVGTHHWKTQGTIYDGPVGQGEVKPGVEQRLNPKTIVGNALFLQEVLVSPVGTNIPLWSLSYEFWYYIAFPLLALSLVRSTSWYLRLGLLLGCSAVLWFVGSKIAAYFGLWLLGALLSMLPRAIPPSWLRLYSVLSFAVFVGACAFSLRTIMNDFLADSLVGIAYMAMMYGVIHYTAPARTSLYRSASERLSKMSYTLYATHLPLLVFGCALLMQPWNKWPMSLASLSKVSVLCAISFALCYLSYLCFEGNTDRFRSVLRRLTAKPSPEPITLARGAGH